MLLQGRLEGENICTHYPNISEMKIQTIPYLKCFKFSFHFFSFRVVRNMGRNHIVNFDLFLG